MLKALWALCALILSIWTGIFFLEGGTIGKLESPNTPLMLGENIGERMELALFNAMTPDLHTSLGNSVFVEKEKNSPWEDMQTLQDLENDIQDLGNIYDEELNLNQKINEWDGKSYDCERKTKELNEQREKIDHQKVDLVKRFEKSQKAFELLKAQAKKEKNKLDQKAIAFKTLYEDNKMEQNQYEKKIDSIHHQKKILDMKIKEGERGTIHLAQEKDRIIEEFEMQKIEIEKENVNSKKLKLCPNHSYHGLNELEEKKHLLTKERMKKQIRVLKEMKQRYEFLKQNISDGQKKKELKWQLVKFNTQLKKIEKSTDDEVSAVKILEDHIKFLKKFE